MSATATDITSLPAGTWTVDPAHTEVGFVARHLMVTKVRGSFTGVSGTVVAGDPITASTVEVSVDISTVDTRSADRDAHLKSGDFFDVESFPTMTFKSTSFTGDELVGDLTIKGVTKPVTFDLEFDGVATDPWGNTKAGFVASTTVNREDFGLTWNAALETGGFLVGKTVTIDLEVELAKQ